MIFRMFQIHIKLSKVYSHSEAYILYQERYETLHCLSFCGLLTIYLIVERSIDSINLDKLADLFFSMHDQYFSFHLLSIYSASARIIYKVDIQK